MRMKELTWRLILPLTIVSIGTFTKWWYVLPDDAPDTMMAGFPLAFVSDGWHTSMSLQIFVVEFILDFLVYFLFWFLLIFAIARYWKHFNVPKFLTGILWIMSLIIISVAIFLASWPDQIITARRNWNMQVMVTGYKWTWKNQDRPDINKYFPIKK